MSIKFFYIIANKLYKFGIPILPKLIYYIQFLIFNSSVSYKCKIGNNTVFGYGGIGVVIHERAVIGNGCIIGQNITIGGRSKKYNVPIVGDRVYIGAGARILGDVKIGNNVIVGANAVVINDVPSHSIVAGIPAKVIKTNINVDDFEDF